MRTSSISFLYKISDSPEKGEMAMKRDIVKKSADSIARVLGAFLHTDANSAACWILHQPKAPKELDKFKKRKR